MKLPETTWKIVFWGDATLQKLAVVSESQRSLLSRLKRWSHYSWKVTLKMEKVSAKCHNSQQSICTQYHNQNALLLATNAANAWNTLWHDHANILRQVLLALWRSRDVSHQSVAHTYLRVTWEPASGQTTNTVGEAASSAGPYAHVRLYTYIMLCYTYTVCMYIYYVCVSVNSALVKTTNQHFN
jgi:hypothetical protein